MQETNAKRLTEVAIQSLLDYKAKNPIVMDLRKLENSVTDYFVIAHGSSDTHVESMANDLMRKLRSELGEKPLHFEGKNNSEWILIDYFDVVIHLFLNEKREFYNLESLWGDAKVTSYDIES